MMRGVVLYLVQKRFLRTSADLTPSSSLPDITSSGTSSTSSTSFTAQFLVNSCGLSPKAAVSATRGLQIDDKNLQGAHDILQWLKAMEFSDTHIAKLIKKKPRILLSDMESNMKRKFDFFIEIGFMGQLLPELVLCHPGILFRSLDSHIKPCFEVLSQFLHGDEEIVLYLKRISWVLSHGVVGNLRANVDFLMEEGVPANRLKKLLFGSPRAICLNPDKMVYAVNAIKDLGLQPKALMFVHAVGAMMQLSYSSWKEKMELMKRIGWSEEETLSAFKRFPYFMVTSEEKIRSAMDLYTNIIKLEKQDIVSCPAFLKYSLDKRVRPRWEVLQILMSNNVIGKDINMKQVLIKSEKVFLQEFVTRYVEQLPALLDVYGCTGDLKKRRKGKEKQSIATEEP